MPGTFTPANRNAEMSVIGSVLIDNRVLDDVSTLLTTEHFYHDDCQICWRHILSMYREGKPIDTVTLADSLAVSGEFAKVGGDVAIAEFHRAPPNARRVRHYADIVRDAALKRSLMTQCDEISRAIESGEQVADAVLADATRRILELGESTVLLSYRDSRAAMGDLMRRIERRMGGGWSLPGLPTGFPEIDDMTGGLQPSHLIILAARPAVGKTSLMLNIVEHVAVDCQRPVGIFSLEMRKEELDEKLLVARAVVPNKLVKSGEFLTRAQLDRLAAAVGVIESYAAPILVDDSFDCGIIRIMSAARKMISQHKVEAIFVDYLQLIAPDNPRDGRQEQVAKMSRGLKAIARCLDVPVVVLAQLNRGVENRESKEPRLSDLRESGAIEQDADVVMFLHRSQDEDVDPNLVGLIVAKNRHGETGRVDLGWHPCTTRFLSIGQRGSQDSF